MSELESTMDLANSPPAAFYGFTESGPEKEIRHLLNLASAFCETSTMIFLRDPMGIWYRDHSGLSDEVLAAFETLVEKEAIQMGKLVLEGKSLHVLGAFPIADHKHAVLGELYVVSPRQSKLQESQRKGLRQVINQIQEYLSWKQLESEHRATVRSPLGASFVPGMVHELRNSIFGISASLDLFKAKFGEQEGARQIAAMIHRSMEKLNAFVEELIQYGNPHAPSASPRHLEPIVREAVEHYRLLNPQQKLQMDLRVEGPLPVMQLDESSLCRAFLCLITVALHQDPAGTRLFLKMAPRVQGNRRIIYGLLDVPDLKLQDVDLNRFFEPFYFRAEGLGRLALPAARRIFESHGGTISAMAGPEGGIRMVFMLPSASGV